MIQDRLRRVSASVVGGVRWGCGRRRRQALEVAGAPSRGPRRRREPARRSRALDLIEVNSAVRPSVPSFRRSVPTSRGILKSTVHLVPRSECLRATVSASRADFGAEPTGLSLTFSEVTVRDKPI